METDMKPEEILGLFEAVQREEMTADEAFDSFMLFQSRNRQ